MFRQMERLIELLNEYGTQEEIKRKWYFVPNHIQWEGCDNSECSDLLIISKKFGFIKWLVENEKIDFSQIPNKIKEIGIPMKINGEIKYGFDSSDYYWLLMLLSIQDNPIDFLISILK